MRPRWTDTALRAMLTALHSILRLNWRIRRTRTFGAHALAFTPERMLILVRLRYARGWRLPGGGMRAGEDPREAVLRELREEIGLTSHGRVWVAGELEQQPYFKRDLASILIVEDVRYFCPRWSWEVEAIAETRIDSLPTDMAPIATEWVNAVKDQL